MGKTPWGRTTPLSLLAHDLGREACFWKKSSTIISMHPTRGCSKLKTPLEYSDVQIIIHAYAAFSLHCITNRALMF